MGQGKPVVEDASDPKQVKRAGTAEARKAQWTDEQYRQVLNTPAGRAVLWDLLERAGLYQPVFSTHHGVMASNAGRHNFGLEILARLIETDEELYLLMEQEARRRAKRERDANEASHASRSTNA